MSKNFDLCMFGARVLVLLVANAIVLLKFHIPNGDEIKQLGEEIQKKFNIKDEDVKILTDYYDALGALRAIEKKYHLEETYVEDFVPSDFFCNEIDRVLEKHTIFKNEDNLHHDLLVLLVGVLKGICN